MTENCKVLREDLTAWDVIISFPFVEDGPVYPMVKGIRTEALKQLPLAYREYELLLSQEMARSFAFRIVGKTRVVWN